MAEFPQAADLARMRDDALQARWEVLLDARSAVNARLEALREKKVIGSSLQASVVLDVNDAAAAGLLKRYADTLPMLFIVSQVTLGPRAASAEPTPSARPRHRRTGPRGNGPSRRPQRKARSARAAGGSCPRSRRRRTASGCASRCVDAMTAGRVAG